MTILVLANKGLTEGMQAQLRQYLVHCQLPGANIHIDISLPSGYLIRKGKSSWIANPELRDKYLIRLKMLIDQLKPRVIIIQDEVALKYLTEKYSSLAQVRGSVYSVNEIPAIVIDSWRTADNKYKPMTVKWFTWLMLFDLQKVARWYHGTVKREPVFQLEIADTMDKFMEFQLQALKAILISCDTETSGIGQGCLITVSGYSFLMANGEIKTWVVPLINPCKDQNRQWSDEQFQTIMNCLRKIHQLETFKVLQNGSYDATHYMRYRMPLKNWIFDTAVGWHSVWPESPKRLDFMASIVCDHYRYWKDESSASKEDKDDDDQEYKLPSTEHGWWRYMRYNGFDTYYPILILMYELQIMNATPWVLENYRQSIRQTLGPCMAMSARGIRVNTNLQLAFEKQHQTESNQALASLRRMVVEPDFNPNSAPQVAALIYDVYKAKSLPKNERSTNESVLDIVKSQHWIIGKVVDKIWEHKKPKNNISKFGTFRLRVDEKGKEKWSGLKLLASRWTYKINATGTIFGRYSSSKSNLWIGQQVQNPPSEIRPMVEPDPGYALFKIDKSKSDMWHTAYAAEEPEMIRILKLEAAGQIDAHCYHAARFYQKPYEEVYRGYRAKEEWVVHSTKGCRQNTKRIVYGANYLMAGFTLLTVMGIDSVRETAIAMGNNTKHWTLKEYTNFCQNLINFYFAELYPGLMPFIIRQSIQVANNGKMATCNGDRTVLFFANPAKDKAAQRALAAFYGQGGSAGAMNKAIDRIFFEGHDNSDCMMLWQMHDEIGGQVRLDKLHLLANWRDILEEPQTFNGHTYVVPSEIEVGLGWGERMTRWHPGITYNELKEADEKWWKRHENLRIAA